MRHAALVSILCAALAGGGVQGFDTVDCLWGHACWASGEQGPRRVAYLVRER